MHILLTVCSLIAAAAACVFWIAARECARDCEDHVRDALDAVRKAERAGLKLNALAATVVATESTVESLRKSLQKLSGKFHATAFMPLEETPPAAPRRTSSPEFCPNYGQAQMEGPRSKAAACECPYCEEMRGRRAQFRRESMPSTAQAQAAHAEANGGHADGE